MLIYQMKCCGIGEIDGISERSPEDILTNIQFSYYNDFPFMIFTEARKSPKSKPYGKTFASFIRANKLGSVTLTGPTRRNPNSGNLLRVWVWCVNWKQLRRWRAKREAECGQRP